MALPAMLVCVDDNSCGNSFIVLFPVSLFTIRFYV